MFNWLPLGTANSMHNKQQAHYLLFVSNIYFLQEPEAVERINTRGCIETIEGLITNNLYTVGGVAIGIALSQVQKHLALITVRLVGLKVEKSSPD